MLKEKNQQALVVFMAAIFTLLLVRTAWISDDAAITLRTVLNFINGYGPTFNIDERVQAYTHPLWFLLISGLSVVVRNVFAATFILSIGVSVLAFWLLLTKVATNALGALVAGAALLLSKAYLDFATSGLENPLSHLLILAAVLAAVRAIERGGMRDLALFFLSCSLIYLNRPDLLVLVFPLAVLVVLDAVRKHPRQLPGAVLLGALPVVAWTVFSVYYYGFPFPNTAYAKLGTGIGLGERLLQGGVYLLHNTGIDPVASAFIVAAAAIGFRGPPVSAGLAAGIVLYLAYVLNIGGDFMEGRFMTAPLLAAAVIVGRCRLARMQLQVLGAGVLLFGLVNAKTTLLSDASYPHIPIRENGIADERAYYFQRFGMINSPRGTYSTPPWNLRTRKTRIICGGLGYSSIRSGPSVHFIDDCALADPLLARLPAKFDPDWRIGHFTRQMPVGYEKSVAANANLLADPVTHAYYDAIRTITRAPLNDPGRLRRIVDFNLGRVPKPDWNMYRYPIAASEGQAVEVAIGQLGRIVDGGPWDAPGIVHFKNMLEIVLPTPRSIEAIDLSVDHNDTYRIDVLTPYGWEAVARIKPVAPVGMVRHQIVLDYEVLTVRKIRLTALYGDGGYALGHLVLK